jgi:hypothetical protein
VILSTLVLALHTMFRTNRALTEAISDTGQLEQFSVQFRSDAHQAHNAALLPADDDPDTGSRLLLSGQGELTVEYTLGDERIERLVRREQTVEHRETYRLPAGMQAHWDLRQGGVCPVAALVFRGRTPGPGSGAGNAGRIDAALRISAGSS